MAVAATDPSLVPLFSSRPAPPERSHYPPLFPGLKIICPTAAKRRSTVPKRIPIHQWFDIFSLVDPSKREYLQYGGEGDGGVRTGSDKHRELEHHERANLLGRVEPGLFGGALCSVNAERAAKRFHWDERMVSARTTFLGLSDQSASIKRTLDDGIFETETAGSLSPPLQALSLLREYIDMDPLTPDQSTTTSVLQTPVLLGHGELDEKVDCRVGRQMADALKGLSIDVKFVAYAELEHWYKVPEQVQDIAVSTWKQDRIRQRTS